LKDFEAESIDCVVTSPPYFREREKNKHFNLNQSLESYIENVFFIAKEIKRILKKEGSFWLNLGDCYQKTSLQLIPGRIAQRLIQDGWILNNDIIWKKTSYTPTSYKKRLSSSYEHFFHFVKTNDFYYNLVALDAKKRKPKVEGESIKTSSNVTGVNYLKIIQSSTLLSQEEKQNAIDALHRCIEEIKEGEISDFRLLIKGHNKVSGENRKQELEKNGFIVIKSKHNKPSDIWEILPEKKSEHYAPYPEDLVEFPIIVTCPPKGVVLDPFVGSGTTCYIAMKNKRRSIGIDIKEEFINYAKERCNKEN
ncbi:MAG: site-specific DNA-methyltransferase, partial [Bacilli bacterium]|nr:site-specific DNA-methyltransferase [Bacilli bacterium]